MDPVKYQINQRNIKNDFTREFLFDLTIPALADDPTLIGKHIALKGRLRAKLKDGTRITKYFNL